ncbi:MAG: RNA binding S1, partial [uncultured bacterium]
MNELENIKKDELTENEAGAPEKAKDKKKKSVVESEIVKDYDYAKKIAAELNIGKQQTNVTLELIRDGNTIPFIARYRKEQTDNLDETVLKDIYDRYEYLIKLMSRKDEVVRS